jgi:DNA polymerase-1
MATKAPIKHYWEREQDFTRLLKTMESRGVLLDQAFCRRERAIGEARMYQLQNKLGDMDPSSPRMLERLFRKAGIPLLEDHKTEKGNYSFNKDAMEDYDALLELRGDKYSDLAKDITEFRGWQKTVTSNYTSYLNKVSPDGRLRCEYRQAGTRTGRLSCADPNLQQIPRTSEEGTDSFKRWNGNLKDAFIAKPGFVLVSNDYSQLEFRLAAAYSNEVALIELFNKSRHPEKYSKEERDVFTQMSTELGRPRHGCKTLSYMKLFGGGKLKIATFLGEDVPQWVRDNYRKPEPNSSSDRYDAYRRAWAHIGTMDSSQFVDEWEAKYAAVKKYTDYANKHAAKVGEVKYWVGPRRRRFVKDRRTGQYIGAHKAYNSLIQGGGAEIVKSAMLRLFREVDGPNCQMLLQVHDSVVFEIRESMVDYYVPIIKEVMSRVEDELNFGVFFATEEEYWSH